MLQPAEPVIAPALHQATLCYAMLPHAFTPDSASAPHPITRRYHVAATYSHLTGSARTYVNGLLTHHAQLATTLPIGQKAWSTLHVGHCPADAHAATFKGRLGNIRVWDRQLTLLDVQRALAGQRPVSLTSATGFNHTIDAEAVILGRLKVKGGSNSVQLGNGDGSSSAGLLLDSARSGSGWSVVQRQPAANGQGWAAAGLPLATCGWRQRPGRKPARPANASIVLLVDEWDLDAVRAAAIRLFVTSGCHECPLEMVVSLVQPYCGEQDLASQVGAGAACVSCGSNPSALCTFATDTCLHLPS